ncbi:PREDICTED: CTD small phosphatase-like protein 2-A isoform X3 [Nelumbo nucifera]|uniref:CTD small phosphatase-like protein 2-A isoform X3 n=1 Tax=Nelumbo nucifera TaxID=4432 RepID=A0A1U7Z8S4_NELNU|nr:PREDICTED: CTD small phosphatase-like protein 2-A isoform X3 [Nelumbo nucifera]
MPALKMKAKSRTGCIKDGNGLRVCQRSSKISKDSCFQVRMSQQEAELGSSIEDCQDVFPSIEVPSYKIRSDEAVEHQQLVDEEAIRSQRSSSSLTDSASIEREEILPATCPSNLETIFSPILQSDEVNYKPNFQSYTEFDDIMEANPFLNHGYTDSSLMFDMAEGCMILPFLEETVEMSNNLDGEPCEEAMMSSDDGCLYLAIHQTQSLTQEPDVSSHSVDTDEVEYFDPQLFIKNLPDLPEVVPTLWPMLLPKESRIKKPITLVLDLDETLVHSTLEPCDDADFTFQVHFNMKEHTVYVRQRPHLRTFLERVAEMFEVIVFTASQSTYAEQLLNILDPDRKLISRRAYRESCIFSDGSYTKDLTVLGVDLAKVAIIDNSPQVFRLQVNNGIPIKSWFDDPSDSALISLLPFLETLVDADDVRPIIAKRFNNE